MLYARRILGLYYHELAQKEENEAVKEELYCKAAQAYEQSANIYPIDDEYHVCELVPPSHTLFAPNRHSHVRLPQLRHRHDVSLQRMRQGRLDYYGTDSSFHSSDESHLGVLLSC